MHHLMASEPRIVPYLVALLLFGLAACRQESPEEPAARPVQPVLENDFNRPATDQLWVTTTLQKNAPVDTIADFPDGRISLSTPTVLKSPAFDVDELQYYRLDFRASASHKAFWAAVFFDDEGQILLADIYSSFDPTDTLRNHTFYFQSKINAASAEFWLRPTEPKASVQLERVAITPEPNPLPIKAWADSVYATIPALSPVPMPADRAQFIPVTLRALEAGEKVRIVMLGNSIINDTGNSAWEVLTETDYPGADVEVITSVRGGTGCWYYRENNRIDTFVIRYNPDLLIIGGISHREDTAAIHDVIRQVRERTEAEILVFSGPVGRDGDPRANPAFAIPPKAGDFRLQLREMAKDAGVGYFDMQTEWGTYIQSSGKPYDFFLRDPVHANARGRQVLARLTAAYFAPAKE